MLDTERIGKEIKSRIKHSGYTVKEVAELLCISPVAIYRWMHGETLPTIDNLVMLARLCGVTVDSFIFEK